MTGRACRECGRPLFDDDHRVKLCDACRDRSRHYVAERQGLAGEEIDRVRRDMPRGYS